MGGLNDMEENMETSTVESTKAESTAEVEATKEVVNEATEKTFTQKELDGILKERLDRQKKKFEEKYADYDSLKAQSQTNELDSYQKKIDELEKKMSEYESNSVKMMKENICLEMGIPKEMASRLNGTDEESIKEDASTFAQFVQTKTVPPKRNSESSQEVDGVLSEFKRLNPTIKF